MVGYTLRTETVVTVQELARGRNITVRHLRFTCAITFEEKRFVYILN